ncbi:MAG: PrsW family intramembrane metalloprotease [Candidatus Omnitrophota bacterium]
MHNIYISLTAAVAPALVILWYFYKQDQAKPEPKRLVLRVFFFGILSTIPLLLLDMLLTNHWQIYLKMPGIIYEIFTAYIQAGFFEELVKLLVVLTVVYRHRHFDEVTDGIIYTITASLGFACLENILYVTGRPLAVAVARALTAVPFHAVCSGVMGYYVGRARFTRYKSLEIRLILTGFILSVLLHGTYNFLLFLSPFFGSLYSMIIIPVIYLAFKRVQSGLKKAADLDRRNNRI